MNITVRQIEFQMGEHTVYGWIYIPSDPVRAVVQLVHGMAEHMGRYHEFMHFLAQNGYASCGIDQCGHGRTAAGRYGFIAAQDGWKLLLDCQHRFHKIVRSELPGARVIMLGHSMGSFIARVYASKYPRSIDALILSGTGRGGMKVELALQLANRSAVRKDPLCVDRTLHAMAFGGYNQKFLKELNKFAWLSSDETVTRQYAGDPMCGFIFSACAFRDLFILVRKANEKDRFERLPAEMPLLLFSGSLDPVGDYGKGPREVCARYARAGMQDVELLLYENGRHEMLTETNREQVFGDLLSWMNERFAPA